MSKKGYKAFEKRNNKLYCRNVQYIIGETYEQTGEIEPCINGLHYCKNILDISRYYDYNSNIIICEIEDIGNISIDEDNKTVTNKLKIIKEIDKNEYPFRRDDKGNIIHYKDHNDNEYCWEYKYDEKGNKIYEKDRYGNEYYWEYDKEGNMIYKKDRYGNEYYWEYDDKNNMIYKKDRYGDEYYWEYDEKGNMIYKKDRYRNECYYEYRYDKKGNMIYKKDYNGNEYYWEYDKNNDMVYYKDSGRNEFKKIAG